MNQICVNGKIKAAGEPVLLASNRGYRYGDGLFETMKVFKGNILLRDLHFERLFKGLSLLGFEVPALFTEQLLEKTITDLSQQNKAEELGRVRLSVFRGNGGLYDEDMGLQYIVECWPLDNTANELNENGLVIDIFPDAKKTCDEFSTIKSASFQAYSLAALFAKTNKLNDCLLLNTNGNIADSTIANLFLVKNEHILTPALSEGCIAGVMRKYLLDQLQRAGYPIKEMVIKQEDLETADELFLTNAIKGIRWVKQFREKSYSNIKTVEIYDRFITALHV